MGDLWVFVNKNGSNSVRIGGGFLVFLGVYGGDGERLPVVWVVVR